MKVITCCKVVPNEEEIQVLKDGTLDFSSASAKISQYDLNALESAKQLAAATSGTMTALSVGTNKLLESSKIRKDILSRGAGDLKLVIDDNCEFADSLQTAKLLADALKAIGDYDVVICGMGSSDLYLQETGVQVGALLDIPVTNHVTGIEVIDEHTLKVERTMEGGIDVLEVPLPAVLCTSSEINVPPVPSMRDIMGAGKKPIDALDITASGATNVAILEQLAPEQATRRQEVIEGADEAAVDALVAFLKKECSL